MATTVTVLHATTIALTPHVRRNSVIAVARWVMKAASLSPYGALAESVRCISDPLRVAHAG